MVGELSLDMQGSMKGAFGTVARTHGDNSPT
jgi:hypothetical protein